MTLDLWRLYNGAEQSRKVRLDLTEFKQKRAAWLATRPLYRNICSHCRQPDFSCYCAWLTPFDPKIQFVILIHPIEARRRIATGRMSHLSLQNSHLITGQDFTDNRQVNEWIADPRLHCVLLYPGRDSLDISKMDTETRFDLIPGDKKLTIFVIDGTWATARKTNHLSQNLKTLQKICFVPPKASNFRIRRQPRVECHSTIEAIHQTINLLGDVCGFQTSTRTHDRLISLFDKVVDRQIELAHTLLHRKSTKSLNAK